MWWYFQSLEESSREDFGSWLLPCHNSTRCPLPSQSAVSIVTFFSSSLLQYHFITQVSSSDNISSFMSRDSLPFFYLWSTSSLLFTQLSLQASHFLFLCLALSDTPISSVLCCYQQHNITFVIQGDLQPSVLSILKDLCSHFVYFQVRHGVRNVTRQQRHISSLTLFQQADSVWESKRN